VGYDGFLQDWTARESTEAYEGSTRELERLGLVNTLSLFLKGADKPNDELQVCLFFK